MPETRANWQNARVLGLSRTAIRGEREVLVRLYSAVKGECKPCGNYWGDVKVWLQSGHSPADGSGRGRNPHT